LPNVWECVDIPSVSTEFWRNVQEHSQISQFPKGIRAKPGREADLAAFLHAAAALAETEPQTLVWFAVRLAPSTFGIFDAFPDEAGRAAHLMGPVAVALGEQAATLLAGPAVIERLDVLAAKQP
jgi:quinol monooxygenase YgiN